MATKQEQAHERRIRNLATSHGMRLTKSRADGTYGLIDLSTNNWVTWTDHGTHGWSLEAVEGWLNGIVYEQA